MKQLHTSRSWGLAFSVLLISPAYAQSAATPVVLSDVVVAQKFDLASEILPEPRQIFVSVPPGYDTLDAVPVVYVLDAEYRFDLARATRDYLSVTTRMPRALVVGIANPSRSTRDRDLLPESYGGDAEAFGRFVREELRPTIEELYRTNSKNYLVGHSHGAVFAVHTLLRHPGDFDGYVAIDPSLKSIYPQGDTALRQDFGSRKLYLASSDLAYGYMRDVAADMQADFAVFKNSVVQAGDDNLLNVYFDHIADDHGNAYLPGLSRGWRYVFGWRFE